MIVRLNPSPHQTVKINILLFVEDIQVLCQFPINEGYQISFDLAVIFLYFLFLCFDTSIFQLIQILQTPIDRCVDFCCECFQIYMSSVLQTTEKFMVMLTKHAHESGGAFLNQTNKIGIVAMLGTK